MATTCQPTGVARPPTAAMQCSGIGYTRHEPFEHIYRHHRRYRITEGAEEIQIPPGGPSASSGSASVERRRLAAC